MSAGRDDIRVTTTLFEHAKYRLLSRRFGDIAAYHLLRLWFYAANNHPSGRLGSEDEVELGSDWGGEPGAWLAALKQARLIEPDGVTIHDWGSEQPWVVSRLERVERCRAAARLGGLASAESRRAKSGSAQPGAGSLGDHSESTQESLGPKRHRSDSEASRFEDASSFPKRSRSTPSPSPNNERSSATHSHPGSTAARDRSNGSEASTNPPSKQPFRSDVAAVFEHFRARHPQARLTEPRKALIRARLQDGYDLPTLKAAIDGLHLCRWHTDTGNLTLEYALRNAQKLEKLLEIARNPQHPGRIDAPALPERTKQTMRAAEQWLRMKEHQDALPGQ